MEEKDRQLKLELERMRLEEREKEREEREKERNREKEERDKDREHELKLAQINAAKDKNKSTNEFDLNVALKLMPVFKESEVVDFFINFEKLAESLKWPNDVWVTLVQSKFFGKAQRIYASLSRDESSQYDEVKACVLKAYELIPEAYRQRFRNLRKGSNQTFIEFSQLKEEAFLRWCESKNVDTYESLKELILIEDFKWGVSNEIKVHLDDKEAETLKRAAKLADEYALSHKSVHKEKRNFDDKSTKQKYGSAESGERRGARSPGPCYNCGRRGHLIAHCPLPKKFDKRKNVSLINTREVKGSVPEIFKDFVSDIKVCTNESEWKSVKCLRDTGAAQSLIVSRIVPSDIVENCLDYVLLGGFPNTVSSWPLVEVEINSSTMKGKHKMAVVDHLPVEGVEVIMANDIMGMNTVVNPVVCLIPEVTKEINAVTRSQVENSENEALTDVVRLFDSNSNNSRKLSKVGDKTPKTEQWDKTSLITAQKADKSLDSIRKLIENGEPKDLVRPKYFIKGKILCRRSRNITDVADNFSFNDQIVVPLNFRDGILERAHDNIFGGHLGVNKTYHKISRNFFWPGLRKDVKRYVKTCHICQVIGRPNKPIPKAPLRPIPVLSEPFSEILLDIVGPLPKAKSGNVYILSIIDRATRYPEAFPLRNFGAPQVCKVLVNFFTKFGLPKVIQTDRGTNFTGKYFQDRLKEWGVKHVTSSPYHPQSQGAVERFHQTLKTLLKKYSHSDIASWDINLPYVLFALRAARNESLGFAPFDLVFGHRVRGPLDLIRENWDDSDTNTNPLMYVPAFRDNLRKAWEFAKENLQNTQKAMKERYDLKSLNRKFEEGDMVLALLPIPGQLKASFLGPYKILKKVSDLDYVIETPDRRKKTMLCHVNMLKKYHTRTDLNTVNTITKECSSESSEIPENQWPFNNKEIMINLDTSLEHLDKHHKKDLRTLMHEYKDLFRDVPGRTNILQHDVDVGEAKPIKQSPYRFNPQKTDLVQQEVDYMLKHGLIQQSNSPWSSPVVLVKKENGQSRLCFDYRKVNSVTVTDSYPLPRVDDCIDSIGNAKYITKLDMLKGYWQVRLTPRAQSISAFVTSNGLYECLVMPFGMKNSASTFQRLMNYIIQGIPGCTVYVDDVVIYSQTWKEHLSQLHQLFKALRKANLVVNLEKCEFAKATITYLGHVIGYGKVVPKESKIQDVKNFPEPRTPKEVRSFLGLTSYYRRFIKNYSDIAFPLVELTKKRTKFNWTNECQTAFDQLKSVLINYPILRSPNFNLPFKLAVDASDVGMGAVLLQECEDGTDHPIAYFSKKLNPAQRKYSTIEKETLSLIMALQHFDVYVSSSTVPVTVFTDHNPLIFIHRFKNQNQRLTRWSLFLQDKNLDIKHVQGKNNVVPDFLSRV